ncbi:MAG: hypothetical protein MR717_04770 [Prevotella sp.]|nr:hypothetical protein [Prevotella sp.]
MNTTFDINRFKNLARFVIVSEHRNFLRGLIGFTVAAAFFFGFNFYLKKDSLLFYPDSTEFIYGNLAGVAAFMGFMIMLVAGCSLFKNMLTKQQRIAFLSLPASNMEKYLVRLLWSNIGYFLLFVIGVCLADALLALFTISLGFGIPGSVVGNICKALFCNGSSSIRIDGVMLPGYYLYVLMTTFALFIHSSWTILGTLFRKNAWLWTICIQVGLGTLWGVIVIDNPSLDIFFENIYNLIGIKPMFWIGIVTGLSLASLMYWGSYRLFCRMQVINNKIVNL